MIVESPNKTKKLEAILGDGYKVLSTSGHLEELPTGRIGVDVIGGFRMLFVFKEGKQGHIDQIRRSAIGADEIYVATDPDREGEAIAYSVTKILPLGIIPKRVTFDAITVDAVQRAFRRPRSIDQNLVKAAHSRMACDRLIGFVLSAKATDALNEGIKRTDPGYKNFSVGRVQSPALGMVTGRTRQRRNFMPEEFFELAVNYDVFGSVGAASFMLKGKTAAHYNTKQAANAKMGGVSKQGKHVIKSVSRNRVKVSGGRPFVTASAQQAAYGKHGIGAGGSMKAMQYLFEKGITTYPRTDSPAVSEEALAMARQYIEQQHGPKYFVERDFTPADMFAQEAHECLRPVGQIVKPHWIKDEWDSGKIFNLIKQQFIASLMADAVIEEINYEIDAGEATFFAKGSRMVFDGFFRETGIPEMREIPDIPEGQELRRFDVDITKVRTSPPEMHNDATVIGSMVEHGIGRPSTYSRIIENLKERGYVGALSGVEAVDKKAPLGFESTTEGDMLVDYLDQSFPWLMDKAFTRDLEKMLDDVARGRIKPEKPVEIVFKKLKETVPELSSFGPGL